MFPPRRAEAIDPSAPELKDAVPVVFGTWPNITGSFGMDNNSLGQNGLLWGLSRAFYVEQTKTELGVASYTPDSSLDRAYYAHIDASRSSTIYKGSALQPKALSVLPCIRI